MNKEQALMILGAAAQQARLSAADHGSVQQAQQLLVEELGINVEPAGESEENGE